MSEPPDEKKQGWLFENHVQCTLDRGVSKPCYQAFTGPDGADVKDLTITRSRMQQGILHVAKLRDIECLYLPQITSLLALFEGKVNVVTRMNTGYGKTAGFETLPDLYRFLFPGFNPVMWIIGPLNGLMQEQVAEYNRRMIAKNAPSRAAHVSRDQEDEHVLAKVKARAADISIVHISVEKAVGYTDKEVGSRKGKRSREFRKVLSSYGNRLVAIVCEEAHTIKDWQHEFRPLYQRLGELRSLAPRVPWTLVSATLTKADVKSLCAQLALDETIWIQGLFTRPNIFLDRVKIDGGPSNLLVALQPIIDALNADHNTGTYTC